MAFIGKRNRLPVIRETSSGFFLDGGPLGEILLPGRYLPRSREIPSEMEVFIYLDSEDRLVATTETPLAEVDEITTLKVVSVNQRVGAFLDWGLPKDLLLPFREQIRPVRVGQSVLVKVSLDKKSQRIIATTRFQRQEPVSQASYQIGQPVTFTILDRTPLGYTALVEKLHVGLLYHDKIQSPLVNGQTIKGFVRQIRPDGKIDLSLDAIGYKRIAGLSSTILEALAQNQGSLKYDDDTSPAIIRAKFGVSKKAFKQALGKLYRSGHIEFTHPGIRLLKP